ARPDRRIRRRPAGGHARRHRGGAAGTAAAAGRGDQLRTQADPRRRAGALGRPRAGGRPAHPGLHPRPRCMDDARGHPAEAVAGPAMPARGHGERPRATRRSRGPRTGGAVGRAAGRVRRDGHPPGRAGRRAAARQAADGRRRVGPWAAPGPGRGGPAAPGLHLTMARVPAAGNGRSRGPRGEDKPGARTGKAAPRVGNASTSDTASARADKAPSGAGTPRDPRPGQRAAARTRRGGTGGRGGASGRRIDPARLVAFDVLRAVRERDAYANLLLPNLLRERGLTGRDAALATELSYGTLRGQGTYDAVISACSSRGLDQIDPPVRDVLRLGTHQLLATRIGAHAAVATSVDLVREVSGPGTAGFVNAVLRRVGTRDLEAWITATAPGRAADPVGHLAVRHSHTRWI